MLMRGGAGWCCGGWRGTRKSEPAQYWAVTKEGRLPALRRFSEAIAAHAGLRPGTLDLPDWREVLTNALEVAARNSTTPLVIIDELPYLLQHSPNSRA